MHDSSPPMDQLLSLLGLTIIGIIRFSYLSVHHRRQQRHLVDSKSREDETLPLVSNPPLQPLRSGPSKKGALVCASAALCYLAVTIYVTWKTIAELEGRVLDDARFMFGRGGMLCATLIFLMRLSFGGTVSVPRALQTDAITLVAIPYVMQILGTPAGSFWERQPLDLVILPMLGAACFWGAEMQTV